MEKFRNKYRIPSARAVWWDYRREGAYFITICTKKRKHFFGEVMHGKMVLSHIGVIADLCWHEIPRHNPNVVLGAWQVMPDHFHGILILKTPAVVETLHAETLHAETLHAETLHATSLRPPWGEISPKSGSVSVIVRSYKSAVTRHARRLGYDCQWQERFWDRIIRDETAFNRISEYINQNPANWKGDLFFDP